MYNARRNSIYSFDTSFLWKCRRTDTISGLDMSEIAQRSSTLRASDISAIAGGFGDRHLSVGFRWLD